MSPAPPAQQHPGDGDAGRTGAADHDAQVTELALEQRGRVAQRGQHHDRGAVLVVVEDRDRQRLVEPPLDLEAPGRGDVLQVDAAEARGERR